MNRVRSSDIDAEVFAFLKSNPPCGMQTICVGVHREHYGVKASVFRLVRSGLAQIISERYINARGVHRMRTLYTIAEDARS